MNYKIILYSLLFISLLFFLIIKNVMMLSLSEIFNPKLSKIEGKVNKFIKKGYNVNITYLYFKGNHKAHLARDG